MVYSDKLMAVSIRDIIIITRGMERVHKYTSNYRIIDLLYVVAFVVTFINVYKYTMSSNNFFSYSDDIIFMTF